MLDSIYMFTPLYCFFWENDPKYWKTDKIVVEFNTEQVLVSFEWVSLRWTSCVDSHHNSSLLFPALQMQGIFYFSSTRI